jgi:hypothetical protein
MPAIYCSGGVLSPRTRSQVHYSVVPTGGNKGRTRCLHPACWSVYGRREHIILVVTIPWVHI